ncbi:MAG: biotin transporter BioY [Methanomassiliicoccales archaeon]|nr:MAG: biotin transporter BioY [Methanomassiliicoccales archaeon]
MNIAYGYERLRCRASEGLFHWRSEAGLMEKLMGALFFAFLTALAAQIRFNVPFTPVPFTGQVLVVLVGAVCLGRYGAVAQGMYLGLGASLGWFSGMVGLSALMGVTGGYLIGFVLASWFLGTIIERSTNLDIMRLTMAMTGAVGIIYACGVFHMMTMLGMGLSEALLVGVLPFLAVDGLKVSMAVAISSLLVPPKG